MNATVVADDMVIALDYTLRLDDGEVVDSSAGDEPIRFIQGRGHILPGLERAIAGMAVGEQKAIVLDPEAGYGFYDEEAFQVLPREEFPAEIDLVVGSEVELYDEEDDLAIPAFIAEIDDDEVVLDLNHPLAGETLYFDVTVKEIRPATREELDHDHVHHGGHSH